MNIFFRRILLYSIRSALFVQYGFHALLKNGAFASPAPVLLSDTGSYIHKNPNPVFKILMSNHVSQFNEASCSVASTAVVLNAALEYEGKLSDSAKITQHDILEKVRVIHWKERMQKGGYKGKRGLPIEEFKAAIKSSLDTFGVSYDQIDVVPVCSDMHNHDEIKKKLKERLISFETSGNCFIIAHFNQGAFVRGMHLPHLSPVGAFDIRKELVLILDVDPEQKEPYWVSFSTFFNGISWDYGRLFKKYGYKGGGYVWIRLKD